MQHTNDNESRDEQTTNDGRRTFEEAAAEVRRAKKLGEHDSDGVLPDPWVPSIEDVPRGLMEAPWICWAFEWDDGGDLTKVPRHGEGAVDYRVSVKDSDNWTDIETALETARRKGWGVGPVFTESNELVGTDIDDGRDPATGEPTSVAREVINRLDTWTEISVSATGYHPIALGELPDGGNKGDVEMYDDARFFAFTGQHVEGTPDDIRARQDEVEAVHREHVVTDGGTVEAEAETETDDVGTDDANRNTHSGGRSDDETAAEPNPDPVRAIEDDTLIERAKNADGDGGYFHDLWEGRWKKHTARWKDDSQSEADAALCRKLAFWTGGDPKRIDRLFRRSGLYRDKWDEPHYSNGDTYGKRTIERVMDDQGVFYDPNRPRTGASSDVNPGVEKPDPGTHGFESHNGGYGYWNEGDEDDGAYWVEWTNFEIEVESFLSVEDDTKEVLELTVHPRNAQSYTVTVEPTVFNELRAFRREIACGRTATFTGKGRALAKVKQFVGTQDAPELIGVRQMCRRDGRLVLPGGSLTADGWEDDPTHRYIEQDIGAESKVQLTPDNDDYDEDDVRRILELLPQTRELDRFLPAIGWFYASPLRSVVLEEDGQFSILSVTGGTGAGKTTTLEMMAELFGIGGGPFSASGTKFTSMRMLSATDCLPVWFDEYKPSDIKDSNLDYFHELLRKSTKGAPISKGNPDMTTTEFPLRAPVVVSGEQRFSGSAEARRSVFTMFKSSTTDPFGKHAHAYAQLAGGSYQTEDGHITHYDGCDLTGHAVAYHQWLLDFTADELADRWHGAEQRVSDFLDEYGRGDIDDAGKTALQTIVYGLGMYRDFADEVNAEVPFEKADIDRALSFVANEQGQGGRRESHLDEFIGLVSLAAKDDAIRRGEHFTETVNGKTGNWEVRLNLADTYPKVSQYIQNHGLDDETEFLGKRDYLNRIKEQVDVEDSYITCYSQNSPPIGRAVGIEQVRAEKEVEAFTAKNFAGQDEDDEDEDEKHWQDETGSNHTSEGY